MGTGHFQLGCPHNIANVRVTYSMQRGVACDETTTTTAGAAVSAAGGSFAATGECKVEDALNLTFEKCGGVVDLVGNDQKKVSFNSHAADSVLATIAKFDGSRFVDVDIQHPVTPGNPLLLRAEWFNGTESIF